MLTSIPRVVYMCDDPGRRWRTYALWKAVMYPLSRWNSSYRQILSSVYSTSNSEAYSLTPHYD